jgi:hypothetical protein
VEEQNRQIISKSKDWFREKVAPAHIQKVQEAASFSAGDFNINPFLVKYLANFIAGEATFDSVARALILPRVLGSSINTIFGMRVQSFITDTLGTTFGSQIPGMDIEFVDYIDGRKKFCQVKAGPRTINSDDVRPIKDKFGSARRLASQNNLPVQLNDYVVGVLYGTPGDLSGHYLEIKKDFPVFVGQEFWERLTGEKDFYLELSNALAEVADEYDGVAVLEDSISKLAADLETRGLL